MHGAGLQAGFAQAARGSFRQPQQFVFHRAPIDKVSVISFLGAYRLFAARRYHWPIVDSGGALTGFVRKTAEDRLDVATISEPQVTNTADIDLVQPRQCFLANAGYYRYRQRVEFFLAIAGAYFDQAVGFVHV